MSSLRRRIRSGTTAGVIGSILSLAATSRAADYVVDGGDPGASDTGPGTAAEPWATLQHGADTATAGDTVTVMPGSYGRVSITQSGAPGALIVFRASAAPDQSLVDPSSRFDPANPTQVPANDTVNAVTAGFDVAASYVRIEGFEVTQVTGRGGIHLEGTDHVEIVGNFLHDLNPGTYDYMGIRADGHDNTNVLVRGNTLYRVQGTGIAIVGQNWLVEDNELSHGLDTNTDTGVEVGGDSDAFRFFGSGHVIRNNFAHDHLDEEQTGSPHIDCFQTFSVYPDSQFAYDILVEGNTCLNMGQMLMSEDQSEVEGGPNAVHDLTFRNNVLIGARAVAVIVSDANDHFTFENNLVARSSLIGISIGGGSHHATVVNNIFYNNYESDPNSRRGQSLTDETCLDGSVWDYNLHYPDFTWPPKNPDFDQHGLYGLEPTFVDESALDYHLTDGSPGIDQGMTRDGFSADKDGVARPQGTAWDIGPYELCAEPGGCLPQGGAGGTGGGVAASGAGAGGGTGASGGAGPTGGAGALSAAPIGDAGDEGGCGCRLGAHARERALLPGWAALLLLAVRARRVPTSRSRPRPPAGAGAAKGPDAARHRA